MTPHIGATQSSQTVSRVLDVKAWNALAFTAVGAFLILYYFHDRFWFARDDGYYAQIAARILAGDVIHRDVQALHTGLIYFTNALALKLFGHDFVSLRYPLILSGTLQAVLTFLIILPRGKAPALVAGIAGASLTIVQFFNPTPHWYSLLLFFALVIAIGPTYKSNRWRLEMIGALLATVFLFRQLTGVFVAIGVLTYLFLDAATTDRRDRWMARAIILIMAAGTAGYLFRKTDLIGWLVFGIWPLLVLLRAWFVVAIDNCRCLAMIARLSVGGAAAFAPMLIYHLATGSLDDWIADSFFDAIALGGLAYQESARYSAFVLVALSQLASPTKTAAFVNGLYWPVLVLATMVLGIVTLVRLYRSPMVGAPGFALPFLGVFYGLVAVHYQDPAYLYFVAGSTFAGLLWYGAELQPRYRAAVISVVVFQSAAGLYYHAAQPISRSYTSVIEGARVPVVRSTHPALDSILMTERDRQTYEAVLALIERYTQPSEPILAIPANADLYFLSGRRNPLPYMFVPFGVRDDRTLAEVLKTLGSDPPRMVFLVPGLSFNNANTFRIMDFVRARYDRLATIGEFEIYRWRD